MGKVIAFICGFVIGEVLSSISMPIPFMLGGIFSALIMKIIVKQDVTWKRSWRNAGLVIVGYGIGRRITPGIVDQALSQIPGIVGVTLLAVLIAILIAIFMYKTQDVDLQSAIMGIMPGGFTQMTAMSDEDKRVDQNIVTVLQSLRLVTIIISVPFLVKQFLHAQSVGTVESLAVHNATPFWFVLPFCIIAGIIAYKIKWSTPYLIGPIVVAGLAAVHFGVINTVPPILMNIAQLSIGLYVGLGLDPVRLKELKRILPATFVGIFAMLFASIGVAFLLSDVYHFSLITSFLAMAPGGLGEMCLVGLSLGENVSIILTYQMFRFLFLNFAVPLGITKFFGPAVPRD